jgi:uncharacterized lipoprotein NlpE involved in copper resistance
MFLGCKNEPKTVSPSETETNETLPTGDTSENALDWNGQYKGTLPCADCQGIATTLTLKYDGSFKRVLFYKGKSDQAIVERGTFEWDHSGSLITLQIENGSSQSYKVGENRLWHLDSDQKIIEGALAEAYILTKNKMDYKLENKTWVLKELLGQGIEQTEEQAQAYLRFNSENAMLIGNNGCNRISMGYELLEGQRIRLAPGISTLMTCPDDQISDRFNEVLKTIDNYTVNNGELHLNKARMAPMAKFVLESNE